MPSRQTVSKLSDVSPVSAPSLCPDDRESAAHIVRLLGRARGSLQFTVSGPGGESAHLSPSLLMVLERAAAMVAEGDGVAVLAQTDVLTTQDAADALGVSRQYLVRLLDRGDIPATKTGTHRRVRAADLIVYRERRDARRKAALAEMVDLAQEAGAYDGPITFGPARKA